MALALCHPSFASSSAIARDLETSSEASSTPSESLMLGQSSSEKVDFLSIEVGDVKGLPSPSLAYRSSWG